MTQRRSYALTLVACLAGAGLAIWAATRVWSLEVISRPGLTDLRTARTGADLEPWVIGLALVALAGTGALLATAGRVRRGLGGLLVLVGVGIVAGAVAGRAGLDTGSAGAGGTLWPIVCGLGGAIVAWGGLTAARHGHRWPGMSARYERRPAQSGVGSGSAAGPGTGAGAAGGGSAAGGVASGGVASGGVVSGGTASGGGSAGGTASGGGSAGGTASGGGSAGGGVTPGEEAAAATRPGGSSMDHRLAWEALDRGDDPTA